jgi:hypothetical protein
MVQSSTYAVLARTITGIVFILIMLINMKNKEATRT